MMGIYFLLAIFSVIISSFSQILLKKGTTKTYTSKIREYLNVYVICGYAMLFISVLINVVAYRHLAYLTMPVVEALGYILVPGLSRIFFHEKISARKGLGILLILLGIVVYHL